GFVSQRSHEFDKYVGRRSDTTCDVEDKYSPCASYATDTARSHGHAESLCRARNGRYKLPMGGGESENWKGCSRSHERRNDNISVARYGPPDIERALA